jgi:hypothetical protein
MYHLGGYSNLSHSFEETAKRDVGAYMATVIIYAFAVFDAFSWNFISGEFYLASYPSHHRS